MMEGLSLSMVVKFFLGWIFKKEPGGEGHPPSPHSGSYETNFQNLKMLLSSHHQL